MRTPMGSETVTLTSIHELIKQLILKSPDAAGSIGMDDSSSVIIEGE